MVQKSPQVVKHVVKDEKWACSTFKVGKNKPIFYITKTRDFKRFYEINKEKSGILRLPIFGTSVHNRPNTTAQCRGGRNIFPKYRKCLCLQGIL